MFSKKNSAGFTQIVDFRLTKMRNIFARRQSSLSPRRKFTTGFTLIELLVVISIIGFLSSVILASLNTARNKAKISAVKSEMSEFVKAIELYKEKTGAYHNCAPCHYTYDEGDVTDTTNFTTAFVQTFQDHKVFNGDITKTLLKAPDVTYYNIYYEGLPSGLATISSTYDCGNQTTFSDYYIRFIVYPNIDLSGSYWSTETEDGEPTGYYCAGH